VKELEHRLYPEAVRAVVSGRVRLEGRTVHILETDGAPA
jgi:folate-dependent phosphoribosylglycinamide formyltransferase PurN